MKYFRYFVYLYVFIGYSFSNAGSYDDFFFAIRLDNPTLLSPLLAKGFDPNTVNPDGQYGLIVALRESSPKVAKVLAEHPATKVDVRNAVDESPLMLAALRGYLELCVTLVSRGAAINKSGWTPLHYAATGGNADIVAMLLKHNAGIDAVAPNGATPLMMGAMFGSTDVVKQLLDAGADPSLKNAGGQTALDYAINASRPDAIALLRKVTQAKP
ncbi:MAG: ankyrin repeat domain-containing protein [Rhodoferax sp.]|nr:ankyrin repeat domain-containing protein [Rhodoferax sp.]